MQIKTTRSLTITTLLKHLFSPHRCELKAAFPRRLAKVEHVVTHSSVRVLPTRRPIVIEEASPLDMCEPKAWPYDTALPTGLPPIPEIPAVRPEPGRVRADLPPQRPLLSDKLVDVMV